jgi:hypothetical protein
VDPEPLRPPSADLRIGSKQFVLRLVEFFEAWFASSRILTRISRGKTP